MLHVILLILKIIGILLLCILGLLLLILLTVLLVPIRYKAYAEHGEELLLVNARASWLLQLVRVRLTHIEGVLHIWVKVLWFTLFDNLKPRKPKVKKARVKTKEIRKKEIKKSNTQGKASNTRIKESRREQVKVIDTSKTREQKEIVAEKKETQIKTISVEKDQQKQSVLKQKSETEITERKLLLNEKTGPEASAHKADTRKQAASVQEENIVLIKNADQDGDFGSKEKVNIFRKILLKIKSIKEKIKNFFLGIKNKAAKWFETTGNIKHKVGLVSGFIKDKINREGFQITYSSLKKLLKHILPGKLRSRIVFGTGDPCSTGQALGAMSILYSFYGDRVQITPDFENKVFEGKHYARGRIRLVTILIIVIKLILDKRFQQLKRNFQLLKEAL